MSQSHGSRNRARRATCLRLVTDAEQGMIREPNPYVWDAQAEVAVGLFITSYLRSHPAPGGTRLAPDFDEWGTNLLRIGREALGFETG